MTRWLFIIPIVPAVLIGAAVILFLAGAWYDWPIADWIWSMLP